MNPYHLRLRVIPDIQFRERGENRADSADSAQTARGRYARGVATAITEMAEAVSYDVYDKKESSRTRGGSKFDFEKGKGLGGPPAPGTQSSERLET